MSDHPAAAAAAPDLGFLDRHHFLLRRLHSLSGIVPVGLFVMMHLFTNFQIATGDFQHEVEFIHGLPTLLILEITIWLSLGFHAALGLVYTFTGRVNVKTYSYADNVRYTLQRVTGILALIFIFLHVATLRWRWNFFGFFTPFFVAAPDGHPLVAATTAYAIQSSWIVLAVYIIGVASVIYHWSNGLWTAAISWGLTVSSGAQRRWGYVCAAVGVMLTIFAVGAIGGAMTYQITPADQARIGDAQRAYRSGWTPPDKATPIQEPIPGGPAEENVPVVPVPPPAAPVDHPAITPQTIPTH